MARTAEEALSDEFVREAIARNIIVIDGSHVTYNLKQQKSYSWHDPEEWVRASTIALLVVNKDYPANRIRTEVTVPRRTPSDVADVVVYRDDRCTEPYLVVENKAARRSEAERRQAIEQGFGNANSLRAPFMLYDEGTTSVFFDVTNFPAMERTANVIGNKGVIPAQYGNAPTYQFIAGTQNDIHAVPTSTLESRIRQAHSIIWSGGKRDPLTAFDEWSKLLFAKVIDERTTPTGSPRRFQVGRNENDTAVANRIRRLFAQASREDTSIFPPQAIIDLSDGKVAAVVRALQELSFTRADVDSVGAAFEHFFGGVFRGELGQYFTRREMARFTVGMLNLSHEDFVIDPTAGSGGFLLEALLQVWHRIDEQFSGQPISERQRLKIDFSLQRVYGIEIHEILGRICKINLLLHHDGHTHIEANRSCLDSVFTLPRLNPPKNKFTAIVGNPPFGDDVEEGDEDHLGENELSNFELASGREKIASEQVILERSIALLEPEGRLGFVLPDGVFNNQGDLSNCPQTREFLAKSGRITAVISLPDFAFRKSGAQNKTSILFFQKYSLHEKVRFDQAYNSKIEAGLSHEAAFLSALKEVDYSVFLAEAAQIGYTPAGAAASMNDLYRSDSAGRFEADQSGTILGEYKNFLSNPSAYQGCTQPDCMGIWASSLWGAHTSHRLDPKYHLFKREEQSTAPAGWVRARLGDIMRRREESVAPESNPDQEVVVMTLSQTGEIRPRQAGKGRNPPEWRGMYFADIPSKWFRARAGDVVYSSIDLWKGCISVVSDAFDGALVTKEFPIYQVTDDRVDPAFLSVLLRSRFYQRAFRAITTGHSNRRRTQQEDFENLEIYFPPSRQEQLNLISSVQNTRGALRSAQQQIKIAQLEFSDLIDGRGEEELPEIAPDDEESSDETS